MKIQNNKKYPVDVRENFLTLSLSSGIFYPKWFPVCILKIVFKISIYLTKIDKDLT